MCVSRLLGMGGDSFANAKKGGRTSGWIAS